VRQRRLRVAVSRLARWPLRGAAAYVDNRVAIARESRSGATHLWELQQCVAVTDDHAAFVRAEQAVVSAQWPPSHASRRCAPLPDSHVPRARETSSGHRLDAHWSREIRARSGCLACARVWRAGRMAQRVRRRVLMSMVCRSWYG